MKEMIEKQFELKNDPENLTVINDYIEELLDSNDVALKTIFGIQLPVEEIFVNICNYAYEDKEGLIDVSITLDGPVLVVKFEDSGIPYNPLEKEDPDISAPAEERPIGGLGIFLTKKVLDDFSYDFQDGKNINTLTKEIEELK